MYKYNSKMAAIEKFIKHIKRLKTETNKILALYPEKKRFIEKCHHGENINQVKQSFKKKINYANSKIFFYDLSTSKWFSFEKVLSQCELR